MNIHCPNSSIKCDFVVKILQPGDVLFHGSKKKIDFCQLGANCNVENYGFSTDNYDYKTYAGKSGKVSAWTF